MIATIAAQSKEAIRVGIHTELPAADLIGYVVEMSVIDFDRDPVGSEWKTAGWTVLGERHHPSAKLVIGPGSPSGVILTAGTTYYVRVRVTGGGESPVIRAGPLKAIT